MVAQILLTQTDIGTDIKVLCNNVSISGAKNNSKNPNANIDGNPVSVLTKSIENPKYVLQGVNLTDEVGTLTYENILDLYKVNYDGSNYVTLNIKIGDNRIIPSLTGATTGIKVVLESFNVSLDPTRVKNAYLPIATLNFVETL